jgi:hypothetical protein
MYFVKVYSAKLKGQHDINRYAYVITLSFFMLNAIVRHAKCCYSECHYAMLIQAESHWLTVITLNVIVLSVIILTVIVLNVIVLDVIVSLWGVSFS